MKHLSRFSFVFLMFGVTLPLCAQTPNIVCATSANPPVVRAEGLAERVGDIVYKCSGVANTPVTGNFTVSLNTNLTNRVSSGNTLTGIVFTVDTGSQPQPVAVQPLLNSQSSLVYNGVSFTLSPQGTATLRIAGIRANATQIPINGQIVAFLAVNGPSLLALDFSQVTVGTPKRGLYVGFSSKLVCAPNGAPLPASLDFNSLIQSNTIFATTRVTEGFGDAFGPRSAWANFNADTGERIIVRYSGFPQGARLFVPDVVAGSDALQPTAGGDFGLPASGGTYAPSATGSLLLARVSGADANGAGGTPVYTPAAPGSSAVSFNTVSELSMVNGSAYAVYEVVDANGSVQETAQFPTFLGLAPSGGGAPIPTSEDILFAPVSNAGASSSGDPIPRFASIAPLPDCPLLGDCGASYHPQLAVDTTPLQYTAEAGSVNQVRYVTVRNNGSGAMRWTATVTYAQGSGWLRLYPDQGVNNTTIRVDAVPGSLTPGSYTATITIDAGTATGVRTVPVTLLITAAAPPPPTVKSMLNSASLVEAPAVPGSLTTIMGSQFNGKAVSVTFDGQPASILFNNDTQINLVVPSSLPLNKTVQMVVTVDGISSAPRLIALAPFAPAIFKGALLNQDSTVNDVNNGAGRGSVIYFFATGLSGAGAIAAHLHDRELRDLYYAGPAPGLMGVQQVNLVVPADLPAMTTQLYVCGTAAAPGGNNSTTRFCSEPVPVTLK